MQLKRHPSNRNEFNQRGGIEFFFAPDPNDIAVGQLAGMRIRIRLAEVGPRQVAADRGTGHGARGKYEI